MTRAFAAYVKRAIVRSLIAGAVMALPQWCPALTGGPDAFGYRFIDSDEVGGPAYDFEDISSTGTPVFLSDDMVSSAIAPGFSFDFYGVSYSSIYISSNGFLTVLNSLDNGCCEGGTIPELGLPDGIISGWWQDLYPPGGSITYETLGSAPSRRFLVQFTSVPHYSGGSPVTFQFKLFEGSGEIEVHYQAASANGYTHSAGIENEVGSAGLQYALQTTDLTTPRAVRYFLCNHDGVVDGGEQCDDANMSDGDGCSDSCVIEVCWTCSGAPSSCTPSSGGSACTDDGDVCTDDLCDGAGSCSHPAGSDGVPCPDDGEVCTNDVCAAGACSHPAGPDGISCPDDGEVCTNDVCAAGACSHPAGADGNSCPDDGEVCTNDMCLAGACSHPPTASGSLCAGDSSLCTGDVCDGAGTCTHPSIVDCSLVSQCHEVGMCDPSSGDCVYCPVGYTAGGGGCQKSYPIDFTLLDNLNAFCDGTGENRYNDCAGAFGFHWTDLGDASVGAVIGADLQFEAGLSCSNPTLDVLLNGNPVGSYMPDGTCSCFSGHTGRTLNGIDVSTYVKSGANAVLTSDPAGSCEGLSQDVNGDYAVVTVTYASPGAPALPNGSSCNDSLYCNGADTCDGGDCKVHAGDPCVGGSECNQDCNEDVDNCYDLPPTACTADANPCTLDQCDGLGQCKHPAGNAGAQCRAAAPGGCDVAEQCDGTNDVCPTNGFVASGGACGDAGDTACTDPDSCNGSGACLPNHASAGTACPNDGQTCTLDQCDNAGACTHPAGNAGTTCRPIAGPCDVADHCDGFNSTCPADLGLPDNDGDGACDVIDPCTNIGDGRDMTVKPKIVVSKINTETTPANDSLSIAGEFTLPGTTSFAMLDPQSDGARVVLENDAGAVRLDATLAGGAYGGNGTRGWKVNGTGTKWTYQDKTAAPTQGITKVTIQDRNTKAPKRVKVMVKGKKATYPIVSGDEPINATVVFGGAASSANGECGETAFLAVNCNFNGAGNKIICKP